MTDPFRSAERPRRRVEFTAGGDASSGRSAALDPPACDPPAWDVHWAELSALVTRAEANRAEMSRLQAERAEVCAAARATVQVTIPVLTLAGLDDDPAVLAGHGPIDAETARALAAAAPCWQRVMIHPITHEPLRVDAYRPGKNLRRQLAARDQHCRWSGCPRDGPAAKPTTRSRGNTAARRPRRTSNCCARDTTPSSTRHPGRSPTSAAAPSSSSLPPGGDTGTTPHRP